MTKNKNLHTRQLPSKELITWDRFVSDNDGGFFQSKIYYEFCSQIEELKPIIIATYLDNSLVGSVLAIIHTNGGKIRKYFSRRAIIIGGPVLKKGFNDKLVISQLLSCLNNSLKNKTIYTEFRNLQDLSDYTAEFVNNGFSYSEHYNVQLPITNFESVQKHMSSSKRRQIRKSINNGVEIIEAKKLEEVRVFYSILDNLYKSKVKKPLPSWSFFSKLFELSQETNNIKYLLIRYKGKIVGGILTPNYNNIIYEWYIASIECNDQKVFPGVLATWAAIKFGIEHNLKTFDFLGAGSPEKEYGVREFKLKFGGALVQHGRYLHINQVITYYISTVALKIISKL